LRKLIILPVILYSFLFFKLGFAETEISWVMTDHSFLETSLPTRGDYILLDNVICHNDNLGSLLCFDYRWRNACLEFFAVFALTDDIPYIFPEYSVPILQVDGNNKINLNPAINLEPKTGPIIPRVGDEDSAFWRVEVGSIETLKTSKEGIVYQLLNGKRIDIFFLLQNGTIMHSHSTLLGIKPLLESVLEKADAVKPVGSECSN